MTMKTPTRCPTSHCLRWVVATFAMACLQPPPDIGETIPVRAEDTRIVVLMQEIDGVAEHDGREAARMIRETILPRAEANARAAAGVHPHHPRAQRLADRLAHLTSDRAEVLGSYATTLDHDDVAGQLTAVRRQRHIEDDMLRLDNALDAAARVPATRGCVGPPPETTTE